MSFKVYKITSNDLYYYGYTTLTLEDRLRIHKNSKNCNKSKHCSSKCLDFSVATIEQLFEYNNKDEARTMETYLIKNNKCVNVAVSILTDEEKKDKSHKWYMENKERILQEQGTLVKCEKCSKEMTKGSTYKHKKICGNPGRTITGLTWECPICAVVMRQSSMYRHKKICGNPVGTITLTWECPICAVVMRQDSKYRHKKICS